MPDVRNCKRCGKIFNYIGGMQVCPSCKDLDEKDFKRVKEYLYQNPGASLSEVSSVLDISVEKIRMYLKEGRLEIIGDDANMVLACESCGKSIRTGRFCSECSSGLERELKTTASKLNDSITKLDAQREIAMRYLNKDTKK